MLLLDKDFCIRKYTSPKHAVLQPLKRRLIGYSCLESHILMIMQGALTLAETPQKYVCVHVHAYV